MKIYGNAGFIIAVFSLAGLDSLFSFGYQSIDIAFTFKFRYIILKLFFQREPMNYVYLSPQFPTNYYPFVIQLRAAGANVLGIGDSPFEHLSAALKRHLTEYYRVSDMHNYDELVRAMGYFTHRYGKLDRFESHNEYWLETEARIRSDFNISGPKINEIAWVKQKSLMKKIYQQAGIPVARGRIIHDLVDAQHFIEEVGTPLVAKPDKGVGAAATYKIHNQEDLQQFFTRKPAVDYLFEEFIQGQVVSFDGLADQDGKVIFYTVDVFRQGDHGNRQ